MRRGASRLSLGLVGHGGGKTETPSPGSVFCNITVNSCTRIKGLLTKQTHTLAALALLQFSLAHTYTQKNPGDNKTLRAAAETKPPLARRAPLTPVAAAACSHPRRCRGSVAPGSQKATVHSPPLGLPSLPLALR